MYNPVANPWKSYRQIATQTAPPGQLILMLYDGALSSLERAKEAFSHAELGERNVAVHNNLQKAVNIVRELNSSLNLEAGGELASTLRDLYLYFESRILESNLKKSSAGLDDVHKHIKELRDAWAKMLTKESQPIDPQNEVWVKSGFTGGMKAERDLREAYREWRRLAEAEGEAIRGANWSLLAACQSALANLREHITSLMPTVHQEWAAARIDRVKRQEEMNVILRGLIEIARRNQILLTGMREAAQVKLKNLNEAGSRLKQLRRSYGQTTLSTWHSLS